MFSTNFEFGTYPISTNNALVLKSTSSFVSLLIATTLFTNLSPLTSLIAWPINTSILSIDSNLSTNTWSALKTLLWTSFTEFAILDKSIAASTAEFPPPDTITSRPWNNGPSHIAQ